MGYQTWEIRIYLVFLKTNGLFLVQSCDGLSVPPELAGCMEARGGGQPCGGQGAAGAGLQRVRH